MLLISECHQVYIGESVALESKLQNREAALRIELEERYEKVGGWLEGFFFHFFVLNNQQLEELRDDANQEFGDKLELGFQVKVLEKQLTSLNDNLEESTRKLQESLHRQVELNVLLVNT